MFSTPCDLNLEKHESQKTQSLAARAKLEMHFHAIDFLSDIHKKFRCDIHEGRTRGFIDPHVADYKGLPPSDLLPYINKNLKRFQISGYRLRVIKIDTERLRISFEKKPWYWPF